MLKPPFGVTYVSYLDLLLVAQGEKREFSSLKHNNEKQSAFLYNSG